MQSVKLKFSKKALVLIYHRVVELEKDPQLLAVSPNNFEKQIKYLKENYNVISLREMINCLKKKKIENKSIAITFDDGYYDNLYYAKDILLKHRVPATFFVSTGYLESNREYLCDELEYVFLLNCPLKKLNLSISGKQFSEEISTEEDAINVYHKVHQFIKYLKHVEREKVLNDIYTWADIDRSRKARPSHRSLNSEELQKLAANDLIDIGAHTVNHVVLSQEDSPSKREEIRLSKDKLEELLNQKIDLFSYPFGTSSDYDMETIELLKEFEFCCGIANNQGQVVKGSDIWQVPRFLIRNWNINEFKDKICSKLKCFKN